MSWLNAVAVWNILYIDVTPVVSHAEMSSLKDAAAVLQAESHDAPQNNRTMFFTPDVSHVEMWPYVASAAALSESHAETAVLMVLSSGAKPATACNKLTTQRSAAAPIIVACCSLWAASLGCKIAVDHASVLRAASFLRERDCKNRSPAKAAVARHAFVTL